VAGRTRASWARFADLFTRRTRAGRTAAPEAAALGEVSPYGSLSADRPPPPVTLRPGDVFGVDTCINFYPREATVRADERCVVLEMLRSVLDTLRDSGDAGGRIDAAYQASAIRTQLALTPWLHGLGEAQLAHLAERAALLTADADEIHDGVLYREGDPADAVYLVRAGTIKLARQRADGEFIFAYLGRGAALGFEPVLVERPPAPLRLVCVTPPGAVPTVELTRPVTVGRSQSCEVVLPDEKHAVSRRHCRLELREGDLLLTDLDSDNGTLLNGEPIREAIVGPGDRITLVDFRFEIVRPPADDTIAGPLPRLATASGLDNFEVVRLEARALRHLAAADDGLRQAISRIARSLEATLPPSIVPDPATVPALVELNLYNSQNTLLIDLDRCTRCDECVRACADAHGGVTRFTRDGPRVGKYLVTLACRSCTDPKCMIGCPVGSIRREGSLEIRIENWCIGCQRCANQCPFGNINMVELPAAPAPAPQPAQTPALRATVCDLCAGFDGPNCVYACPHDAAIRVNPASFLSAADLR
jgi:Fe-S-cluster-containing hydrogenase component 2/CRP-like cAMP-binding protein